MSFGYSTSEFVFLVQLAHRTFRNCQKAGAEYREIAREVRSLHSVLRTLRDESEIPRPESSGHDSASRKALAQVVIGCRGVLAEIGEVLRKYEGLGSGDEPGLHRRMWQRLRFGSKLEELVGIRGKLITYTSMISVLLDGMQLKASRRVEAKVDNGFENILHNFEGMRREIRSIVVRQRSLNYNSSSVSILSLETYDGDDKAVWTEFRQELVKKGFNSKSLDRHKSVLLAYMLDLNRSGIIEVRDKPGDNISKLPDDKYTKQARISPLIIQPSRVACIGMPILELGSQDWEKLGKLIANRIFAPASFPPPPLSISTAKARDWKHVNFSSPPIVPKTAPTTRYKSILKPSTPRFQEDASLVREGSADRMDAGTLGIPIHLRKTRFEKDMVDPTVLLGHLATWRIEMTEESIIFLESMPVNYGIFLAEASNRMRRMRVITPKFHRIVNEELWNITTHKNCRFEYLAALENMRPSTVAPIELSSTDHTVIHSRWIDLEVQSNVVGKYSQAETMTEFGQAIVSEMRASVDFASQNTEKLCSASDCSCRYWIEFESAGSSSKTVLDYISNFAELGCDRKGNWVELGESWTKYAQEQAVRLPKG